MKRAKEAQVKGSEGEADAKYCVENSVKTAHTL